MDVKKLKLCLQIVKQGNCGGIDCFGRDEGPFKGVTCPLGEGEVYVGCDDWQGPIAKLLAQHIEENIDKESSKKETDKVIDRSYAIQFLGPNGWLTLYYETSISSPVEAQERLKTYRECAADPNQPEEPGEYRLVVDERKVFNGGEPTGRTGSK